jgi:hypothetical protein
MPYDKNELKTTNINYLNKDFDNIKRTLMEYAKSYFPNTYKDFNETSPGMMLIEMGAYVGDVLSFYIDQQYKEMMLPLAEERRNMINIANMLGYKVNPIAPAYTTITATQTVPVTTGDINNILPAYEGAAMIIDKGLKIRSSENSDVVFETLDMIDFTISSSSDPDPVPYSFDDNGVVTAYQLSRQVRAMSGETKEKTFTIGSPKQYLKLTIPETNVVEITKVIDGGNNKYYHVDYLAQDKIIRDVHYTDDWVNGNYDDISLRQTAYNDLSPTTNINEIPVPYVLKYLKTSKRFITEINEDDTTSLMFGNGLLRVGTTGSLETGFYNSDNAGIVLPGDTDEWQGSISPKLGTVYSSLGETPSNTTLTITYKIGGGLEANVPQGDLTTYEGISVLNGGITPSDRAFAVKNNIPARGGSSGESVEEIRQRAKAFFETQNRCVTKEDYTARVLNMPAKFGNIAKVYVERSSIAQTMPGVDFTGDGIFDENDTTQMTQKIIDQLSQGNNNIMTNYYSALFEFQQQWQGDSDSLLQFTDNWLNDTMLNFFEDEIPQNLIEDIVQPFHTAANQYNNLNPSGNISVYIVCYDNNKNLTYAPNILMQNIKNYLSQFRMITDDVAIKNGYIVNFGVIFDVVANRSENKSEVKMRCIQKIIDYFTVEKMDFKQAIYTSDLEYELMGVDGVRAVNDVVLTQGGGETNYSNLLPSPLYSLTGIPPGSLIADLSSGYGYNYNFSQFYGNTTSVGNGTILPSVEPSIFELKNPNQNVKGVVR